MKRCSGSNGTFLTGAISTLCSSICRPDKSGRPSTAIDLIEGSHGSIEPHKMKHFIR